MLYSLLSPGKQRHQLSPLGGGWLAVEDLGWGSPLPPPPPCGWCREVELGCPSVQHQGAQHRIGTASFDTGQKYRRGQLGAAVASHAPAPGNGGQAPDKASQEEAGVEWEDGSQVGVLRPQAAADGGPQAQGIRVRQPGRGLRNDSRTRCCSLAGSAPWLQVTSLWWCAGQRAVGASPVWEP